MVDASDGATGEAGAESERRDRVRRLISEKRSSLKRSVAEKEAETERARQELERSLDRWSGFRIAERSVREDKLAAAMRGKKVLFYDQLGELSHRGRDVDHVVFGVQFAGPRPCSLPPEPAATADKSAEILLTNLDRRRPLQATLVFSAGAHERWTDKGGAGRSQCTVGSIWAVLNPEPTRRVSTMRVRACTQVLRMGTCPVLAFCPVQSSGVPCQSPYDVESGCGLCPRHAAMSHGERGQESFRGDRKRHTVKGRERDILGEQRARKAAPLACDVGKRNFSSGAFPREGSSSSNLMSGLEEGDADNEICDVLERAKRVFADFRDQKVDDSKVLQLLRLFASTNIAATHLQDLWLYEQLGAFVNRGDELGAVAKRLRRSWRICLADGRLEATSTL